MRPKGVSHAKTYWLTDWQPDWATVSRKVTLTLTGAAVVNVLQHLVDKEQCRLWKLFVWTRLRYLNTAEYSAFQESLRVSGVAFATKLCRLRIEVVASSNSALGTASTNQKSSCEEARKQYVTREQIRPTDRLVTHCGLNLAFLIRK
jgi:hypothetical protein